MGGAAGLERRSRDKVPDDSGNHFPNQLDETDSGLTLVMSEIVELMGGRGGMLTLHPHGDDPVEQLFVDRKLRDLGIAGRLFDICRAVRPDFDDGKHFWRVGCLDGTASVLLMPVDRTAGHGRLVVSILFDPMSEDVHARADRLYLERRPFAVGYFQLWQANRQLTQRAAALEDVLDQTAIGVLLLDRSSRVVFANQTGKDILAVRDGISVNNGAPRATHLADGVNFQAALSHALGDLGSQPAGDSAIKLLTFRRTDRPPLIAALLRRRHAAVRDGDVAAAMYIVDPVIDTVRMLSPLCRLYNLSRVESVLACHLAAGETLATAADLMHIKEQTARSYLKAIFLKTDTNRQTELVVLLFSGLIRMNNSAVYEVPTAVEPDLG